MSQDNLARRLDSSSEDNRPTPHAVEPLGRVVSVGGSQVIVEFSNGVLSDNGIDLTVGAFLGIWNGRTMIVGSLCDISLHKLADGQQSGPATGRVDLLGELILDKPGAGYFQRGVTGYPKLDSPLMPIGHDALSIIFDTSGPNTINIGYLQQDSSIGAYIDVDNMVRKHFAIFGSTGAGKSSAVSVLLRGVMEARPKLRILLIDPHNEYASCFGDHAHVVRPGNLRLPYWLFNFDEMQEIIFGRRSDIEDEVGLLAELIPLAKNEYAKKDAAGAGGYRITGTEGAGYTVDTPVPYRMSELIAIAEARMGKLENTAVSGQYRRLISRIQSVRKNPRYSFIFDDDAVGSDTMVDILCELLRLEGGGPPMTIVQLAGFPAEVFDAIVSVLFRLAFEFGLWSDGALPLLIVCEEAHNYANADRSVGFRPAREAVSRIAKEGRKYGVFLGLVTQRPAQLDPTLISQCSTVFAMRIANEDDQRIVNAAVSDPANRLLGFLSSLGTREALAFGAGVPIATRLRFKHLPDQDIPTGEAVWGVRIDAGTPVDRDLVASVVARWRGVARSNKPTAASEPTGLESLLLRPSPSAK
jgi:DNA helicase HerA-like ATPase